MSATGDSSPAPGTAVDYGAALDTAARDVDAVIADLLSPDEGGVGRLWEAMRYAALGGGKRLRPFLTLASAAICGAPRAGALRTGAAIEMLHTYSLVHDDLPAMDDDDMRRGQPTLHRAFDEATAILAGDALLTLAFEVLADPATHADPAVRAGLVSGLARAGGPSGMAGGQMLDLTAPVSAPDEAGVRRLQALKTGALFVFSCEAGAILARAGDEARGRLRAFGTGFGLAFQITDDILDATGDAAAVGKAVGKDAEQGKATLVASLGVEGARAEALKAVRAAVDNLDFFGEKAELLRVAANRLIDRRL